MTTKSGRSLLLFFTVAIGLIFIWQEAADAARFGKRRSFGSKPSYQRSAQPPAKQATTAQKSDPKQQTGTNATQPQRGRWGGMLGGMLMGGLIGSMLFGGGFGGGAGLLDLLLIGGGLMLLFRFLKARRMAAQGATPEGNAAFERGLDQPWTAPGPPPPPISSAGQEPADALPPGFDADEFVKGAATIYTELQAAWDRRDLEAIRAFTSPEVFAEIEAQANEDPTPGKTELLMVEPRILEVQETESQTIVSVLYDVMMRESEDQLSKQVRELWHFSRDRQAAGDFWRLEGLQQIEQ